MDFFLTALAVPIAKFATKQLFGDTLEAETLGGVYDWLSGKLGSLDDADRAQADVKALARSVAADLAEFARIERFEANAEDIAKALGATVAGVDLALVVVDARLDPTAVASELNERRPADAIEPAYGSALGHFAAALCGMARKLDGYGPARDRAVLETLHQLAADTPTILAEVRGIAAQQQAEARDRRAATDVNERDYRAALRRQAATLRIFGLDRPEGAPDEADLDISYIPLQLQLGDSGTVLDFADALALLPVFGDRLLIEGIGGCGKTTLLQWTTLRVLEGQGRWQGRSFPGLSDVAKRVSLPGELKKHIEQLARKLKERIEQLAPEPRWAWHERTPFLVRLREFADGKLPSPEGLVRHVAPQASGVPDEWVRHCVASGRALFLFDGLDEVPVDRRDELAKGIQSYLDDKPGCQVVLTSRPGAVDERWRQRFGGLRIEVRPMAPVEIERFVEAWHRAAGKDDADDLRHILGQITGRPSLAALAETPLLCAAICYLGVVRRGELPERLHRLLELLCRQLADRLDLERLRKHGLAKLVPALEGLDDEAKLDVLGDLAAYMVGERASVIERDVALVSIRRTLARLGLAAGRDAGALLDALQERSGVLRGRSRDSVEFAHNRLRSYLAARAFCAEEVTKEPIRAALEMDDPDLPVLTGALSTMPFRTRMVEALLEHWTASISANLRRRRRIMALRIGMQGVNEVTRAKLDALEPQVGPPCNADEAAQLAELKDRMVPALTFANGRDPVRNSVYVRCLRLIGGSAAREALNGYVGDTRESVVEELAQAINPLAIPCVLQFVLTGTFHETYGPIRHIRSTDIIPNNTWQRLNLNASAVTSLSFISKLDKLAHLYISKTRVNDVCEVQNLTKLKWLNLSGTAIADLKPLAKLFALEVLSLRGTAVTDLQPLAALTALQELRIDETAIAELHHLDNLTSLRVVGVKGSAVGANDPTLRALRNRGVRIISS